MSCSNCGSGNTRLVGQGLTKDTYYCLNCGHRYDRTHSTIRNADIAPIATFIGGPVFGAIVWAVLRGGDDAGGASS